jgi:hypothetical protein
MRRIELYLTISFTLLFAPLTLFSQNGPGGVGDQATNPLWLRAGDLSSLSSGQPVNIPWPDASGNGNDATQGTALNQPIYVAGVVNGKAVVRFDGVNDLFYDIHSYNANTVFVVYRVSSTLQDPDMLGQVWGNYDNGAHIAMDARVGNPQGFSFDGTPLNVTTAFYGINGSAYVGPVSNNNTPAWQYNNFEIVAVEFTAAKVMTKQTLGSLYSGPSGSFPIGTHQYGGDIAEIIVFNNALNATERIVVENYLSSKYNLNIAANGIDLYSN